MNAYVEVEHEDWDSVRLRETVFVAYNDVHAAGSRALLGLDMRMEHFPLHVPELARHRPSCTRPTALQPRQQPFSPLQILNCKYEQFSAVILNTDVRGREAHYVVSRILDLCRVSDVKKLYILSVLQLPHHVAPDHTTTDHVTQLEMFELALHSQPVSRCPSLPPDTPVCDPVLCTFLQMIQIERIPSHVIILPVYPGHSTLRARDYIAKFQDFISTLTKLRFNSSLSSTLDLSRQKTSSWKTMYG